MLILASIIIIVLIIGAKVLNLQNYWKDRKVRYVKPWPFFGYMAPNVFRRKSFADIVQALYNTFPEQRYFGCYQFLTPILMVRDPELIKRIMIKNFDTFPQHKNYIDDDVDPVWAKNLFAMKGDERWREMRSVMSRMFTNSNLKQLFEFMQDCAKAITNHYQKSNSEVEVDIKDITSKYANDVIASTVFGVNCNSVEDPRNEFYLMSKEVTDVSPRRLFKFFLFTISPRLAKLLNFRVIDTKHKNFYSKVIQETIEERFQKGIVRPDMIHLLMEARKNGFAVEKNNTNCAESVEKENLQETKNKRLEITDEDIIAQAIIFFFAGFETVSTAISHLIYELALNSVVQERLWEEINSISGDITYEHLFQMKYLDMIVSETLRKWPSKAINDRECTADFTIEPEQVWENTLKLEPKTLCAFPVYAIHRDPKIYPNPNLFDPERFSDSNKHTIKPFTYLPFGAGPRNCIGSQFAILEIKTFVVSVVGAFEIVRTERTREDLAISRSAINIVFDKGFWVGLKPRRL